MALIKRGSEVTTCLRETVINEGFGNSLLLRIKEQYLHICKLGVFSDNPQKSKSSVNSIILNLLNNTTNHQISDRKHGSNSPSN